MGKTESPLIWRSAWRRPDGPTPTIGCACKTAYDLVPARKDQDRIKVERYEPQPVA